MEMNNIIFPFNLREIRTTIFSNLLNSNMLGCITFSPLFFLAILIIILSYYYYFKKPANKTVYMLDFACYKPEPSLMCSIDRAIESYRLMAGRNHLRPAIEQFVDSMRHMAHKAGIGDSTYISEALLRVPPNPSIETARQEMEMVMFGSIDELLAKINVQCRAIGILVVISSVFNVVPCLSSMIINRYKLKENIISYNVTGMGCSAGLLAIGLVKNLLQVHNDQYALVVTTEGVTQQVYLGIDKFMMATNCIFRVGGAAILLSNRSSDKDSSKYELQHEIQVNNAASDLFYNAIFLDEDEYGNRGITITKDLLVAAKNIIEKNLALLGPRILPLSEKLRFLTNIIVKQCYLINNGPPRYVPKFNKCIDHFFPHVGGKPVLDEMQKIVGFTDTIMEASRMSLYRFGNTSSNSVWYSMAYSEAKGRIKKGDKLWQIAYGSGFRCSSIIWRALKKINCEEMNPWSDEIDQFPVNLGEIGPMDLDVYYIEPTK